MNIRCGSCKGRHISVAAVRECYWQAEADEAMMEEARAEESRERSSGWWNLPIAASMWAADGRDLHA